MLDALNHGIFSRLAAPPGLDGVGLWLAVFLAQWVILVAPAILVALWLFGMHQERRAAVAAALTGLLALAAAHVLSGLIVTPRPFMDGSATNVLDHRPDSSFPSDHCALLFGLAFAFLARPPARWPRLWLAVLASALAVGWARIFLGAHYPLDIVGAFLVAAGAALCVASRPGKVVSLVMTQAGESIGNRLLRLTGGIGAHPAARKSEP